MQNLIFPFDYIIIIISTLVILYTFWKGFISSLLGLLTWVGSIIITIYSYPSLIMFINDQLIRIKIFSDYEQISYGISMIISIPIIFLISLFILRKIRKTLSSDLDKQILGMIFDKFFGLVYGLVFSYLIFSTLLYGFDHFGYFTEFNNWLLNNSYILNYINETNINIISNLSLYDEIQN